MKRGKIFEKLKLGEIQIDSIEKTKRFIRRAEPPVKITEAYLRAYDGRKITRSYIKRRDMKGELLIEPYADIPYGGGSSIRHEYGDRWRSKVCFKLTDSDDNFIVNPIHAMEGAIYWDEWILKNYELLKGILKENNVEYVGIEKFETKESSRKRTKSPLGLFTKLFRRGG